MTPTHAQRKKIRNSIRGMSDTIKDLEKEVRGGPGPHASIKKSLYSLAGTDDPEAQLKALTQVHAQIEQTYMESLRSVGYRDLTAFCEYLNPEEPPESNFHIWLCDHLMAIEAGETSRMCLSVPPGHAKSTYASRLFSAWYMGRNPTHRYIQAGHTQGFCENEFGKKTRAIIENQRYRDMFPEIFLSSDSKAAGYWSLAQFGGSYLTRGVGQAISGFRSHCAGVDDPFATREDAESQTIRDKVYDWFSADFTTRLLPYRPMFVVATRWHTDDLIGRLEDMSKQGRGIPWLIINLPALCENPQEDPLNRGENEPLWPEFYDSPTLLNLKATLPPRDWNSLYRGQPVDAEGGVVNVSWFQRYSEPPAKEHVRRTIVSVDSANKDNERADYTAIGVWQETGEGHHYLRHVIRKRAEFNEMVESVENAAIAWEADAILMEDKGSGTQFLQTRGAPGDEGTASCPAIAISTNNNSKEFRMDGVAPMIEGGLVYLPERAPWLADYESEVAGFPTGKNDDQCDMTSQYLDYARKRLSGGTKKLGGTAVSHGSKSRSRASSRKQKVLQEIELKLRQISEARQRAKELENS